MLTQSAARVRTGSDPLPTHCRAVLDVHLVCGVFYVTSLESSVGDPSLVEFRSMHHTYRFAAVLEACCDETRDALARHL